MKAERSKHIHLGARLPASFDSCDSLVHLARTAERGQFDFVLVDDGARLREQRSDALTMLAALAAVTDRVGLVGTVDTGATEPFEVARRIATLDHLSDGRAGWHRAGADVRRACEFLAVARLFWDSWAEDAVLADHDAGRYVDPDRIRAVEHRGPHFDVRGFATLPRPPQRHPVLVQDGDSEDGTAFAAAHADAVITPHAGLEARQRYVADVRTKVAAAGRNPDSVTVFALTKLSPGSPAKVADEMDLHVQSGACDGFLLVPDPTPHGLDEFVDDVVPLLQERGSLRTGYCGHTLRDHLAQPAL